MKKSFAIFFISSLMVSCASQRMNPLLGQKSDTEISKKDLNYIVKRRAQLWSRRDEEWSLKEFIRLQEKIALSKNASSNDFVLLARAHLLRGEYYPIDPGRCQSWEDASHWAEKALTFNREYRRRVVDQKLSPIQALDTLKWKDAEALYWFASAVGKWSSCKDISTALKYKDRVKKMMDRAFQLNPEFSRGVIHRYYGIYYSQVPGYNPDDLKLSKNHFEKAIELDPGHFAHRTSFAEFYAKKMDDPSLYREQLEAVVQTIPNRHKEDYPEQLLEQKRAKKLLEGTSYE